MQLSTPTFLMIYQFCSDPSTHAVPQSCEIYPVKQAKLKQKIQPPHIKAACQSFRAWLIQENTCPLILLISVSNAGLWTFEFGACNCHSVLSYDVNDSSKLAVYERKWQVDKQLPALICVATQSLIILKEGAL